MRLTKLRLAAASIITAALAFGPVATAEAIVLDPPGKAGANQYFETIPSAGGNAAPPSGTATHTPSIDRDGPGHSALRKLQKSGADGQAAANFAATSAPTVKHSGTGAQTGGGQAGKSSGSSPSAAAASSAGGSAFSGVFHVLGGSDTGGIGVFMPILLIGGLLTAIAAALLRRRRDDAPPTPSA